MNQDNKYSIDDHPLFAGCAMFLCFLAFLISLIVLNIFPFGLNWKSYLVFWFLLSFSLFIRKKIEIDFIKKQLIYTYSYFFIKKTKIISLESFDGIVVKMVWVTGQSMYRKGSGVSLGGLKLYLVNTKDHSTLFIKDYIDHKELDPIVDRITKELGLEIRDEYQERIDASRMKRNFGIYR